MIISMVNTLKVKFNKPFTILGSLIIEKSVIKFTEPEYTADTFLFFIDSRFLTFNKCIFNGTAERAEYTVKVFVKLGLLSEQVFDDIYDFLYSEISDAKEINDQ